jgi:hypothetical protein
VIFFFLFHASCYQPAKGRKRSDRDHSRRTCQGVLSFFRVFSTVLKATSIAACLIREKPDTFSRKKRV